MKKLKRDAARTVDRLSELPDPLIEEILAFLPMRDVVKTSLLSRRWIELWTTIPCLHFNETGKTLGFINRALQQWNGAYIRKLEIIIDAIDRSRYEPLFRASMPNWLRIATEKQVKELNIELGGGNSMKWALPKFVHSCRSITQLSLQGCRLHRIRRWNCDHLKILTLRKYELCEDEIDQVLSLSPQLEIMNLDLIIDGRRDLNLRSDSLKRLCIRMYGRVPGYSAELILFAPKLEAISMEGEVFSKCLLLGCLSLTQVTLRFYSKMDAVLENTLMQILPAIQYVEAVTLTVACFKMLGVMKPRQSFSPLLRVKLLEFIGGNELIEPKEVVSLFEIFPKVKKLVIVWKLDTSNGWNQYNPDQFVEKYSDFEANNNKSFLMQLRVVVVKWYTNQASMFKFIEFLLNRAKKVQKLVMIRRGDDDNVEVAQRLVCLQESFPSVDVDVCNK